MVNSTYSTDSRGTLNRASGEIHATGWRLFDKRTGSQRENSMFRRSEIWGEVTEQWFTE
ncbi:hypothetical protein Desti_3422 [Desulfomonile tiedjei DSM 6799]|uniref:Uncharacterized protein n=1 Tax=Desulfomonile tiedjei (strain ATCC 49306 / DSM 6799 / DCB-1) TaxID=706587 RepID=I4C934_DESTA|nr:hypothetical protein Desti_3422 [Desulfomonile tiedjei DSM 6799]